MRRRGTIVAVSATFILALGAGALQWHERAVAEAVRQAKIRERMTVRERFIVHTDTVVVRERETFRRDSADYAAARKAVRASVQLVPITAGAPAVRVVPFAVADTALTACDSTIAAASRTIAALGTLNDSLRVQVADARALVTIPPATKWQQTKTASKWVAAGAILGAVLVRPALRSLRQ